jgi:hypothetical protein
VIVESVDIAPVFGSAAQRLMGYLADTFVQIEADPQDIPDGRRNEGRSAA